MSFIKLGEPYSRYAVYAIVAVVVIASVLGQYSIYSRIIETRVTAQEDAREFNLKSQTIAKLIAAGQAITEAAGLGAPTTEIQETFEAVKVKVFTGADTPLNLYKAVTELYMAATKLAADQTALNQAAEQIGIVIGSVTSDGKAISGAAITVKGSNASAKTDVAGQFTIQLPAGTHSVTASKSGYNSRTLSVTVTAKTQVTATFSLTIYVAPPPATTNGPQTNGDSSYVLMNVESSAGTYSTHVATFNLASGQFTVITDTANDADCAADCPTKSLGSYVSYHGAFAGINGTYFCPADYASCADEKNHFFWKVLNYRNGVMINANSGLGDEDPFIAFAANGTARYFSYWGAYGFSGFPAVSGINSKPLLVSGGSNVLNPNSLDDKQRYTKSNRGAIGLNGQMLYLVIAKSATVVDLAAVMDALDVEYALNIDGGGSSALVYNNSYKVGPGRSIPNALVIRRN